MIPKSPTPHPEPGDRNDAERQRVADLLGRLLARHWLRTRSAAAPDPEPPLSPRQGPPNP
jgi:hypothetical protein